MQELIAQGQEAFAKGDVKAITQISRQIKALSDEEEKGRKAELTALHTEVYEALQKAVLKVADKFKEDLAEVGITSFTYKVEANAFSTKGSRVRKGGGGGGGGAGRTKAEHGMSLGEMFEQFATPEERKEFEVAQAIPDLSKRGNKTYQVKVAVKKRVLAEGLLQPQA